MTPNDAQCLPNPATKNPAVSYGGAASLGSAAIYGGAALCVLAGAAISTYLWKQRVKTMNLLNSSPLERAEELIANCESKLEDIERAFEELKGAA
jgi:hypothetical protein